MKDWITTVITRELKALRREIERRRVDLAGLDA